MEPTKTKTAPELSAQKKSDARVIRADYWAVVIAFWLVGIVLGVIFYQFFPDFVQNNLSATLSSLVLLALLVGLSSALFFGQAGPLSMGLVGWLSASWMQTNALIVLVSLVPFAFMSASGSILGRKMREDFKGIDNWRDYSRDIVLYFGVGLILAIIAGFLVSALPVVPFSLEQIGLKG